MNQFESWKAFYEDEIGDKVPMKWAICERCDGDGSHANPAFDGMTTDQIYEDYGNEADEFLEEYCRRGGAYDVRCEECEGSGKVKVLDEDRADPVMKASWAAWQAEMYELDQMERMERMMGA